MPEPVPNRPITVALARVGSAAALLIAAGYLLTIPLFASAGAPPVGAEARLAYHAANSSAWVGIIALSVATDLGYLPLAIALHAALSRTARSAMHAAVGCIGLFVVLDLAVTWPAYAALATLGGQLASADAAGRAALVAAAGSPAAVLGSPLQAVDSILTLSVGLLLAGAVAWRGRRGRASAAAGIAGVATGIAGVASVAQTALTGTLSPLAIVATLGTIGWLLATAVQLPGEARVAGDA